MEQFLPLRLAGSWTCGDRVRVDGRGPGNPNPRWPVTDLSGAYLVAEVRNPG